MLLREATVKADSIFLQISVPCWPGRLAGNSLAAVRRGKRGLWFKYGHFKVTSLKVISYITVATFYF